MAVDLYHGKVADTRDGARSLIQFINPTVATETLKIWVQRLRENARAGGKVTTIGWCFGGGWSLNASLAAPVDAQLLIAAGTGPRMGVQRHVQGHCL